MHAPVRADLSAGFPDVAPFCAEHPGLVVNLALTLSVHVVLRRRPVRGPERRPAALADRLVAWTARELGLDPDVDVEVRTPGLTPGSGLGASGALSVAIAHGLLAEVLPAPPSAPDVAALAVRAERAAGVHGGTQDQWASACGGLGTVRQSGGSGERVPLATPPALAGCIAFVHPGGTRDSGTIVRAVTADAGSARSRAVVAAMNAVAQRMSDALRRDDVPAVAGLVAESCALQASLHPGIVSARTADVLRRAPGVRGAKPCGAGGDSATWIVLVDPGVRADFDRYVRSRHLAVVTAAPSASGVRTVG